MPGFLSAYEGTERIDLGDGYWVDVKKSLSSKEYAPVENALGGTQRIDLTAGQNGSKPSGRQSAVIDVRTGRTELVVASLVAWNLDDADGSVWPLDPDKPPYKPGCGRRQSVDRLPESVFDRIWQRCDAMNGQPDPQEAATFPDPAERGDPDGDGGAAGPGPVPDGGGVLAEAGAYQGDAGGPPAP